MTRLTIASLAFLCLVAIAYATEHHGGHHAYGHHEPHHYDHHGHGHSVKYHHQHHGK